MANVFTTCAILLVADAIGSMPCCEQQFEGGSVGLKALALLLLESQTEHVCIPIEFHRMTS